MGVETEGVITYPHAGRIVGTPTEAQDATSHTLTVVDPAGNAAPLTFVLATGAEASPSDPGPGPEDRQPTFGDATVETQR